MAGREIKVTVIGDAASLSKALKDAQVETAKADNAFDKFGDRATKLGGQLTKFATLPIAAGMVFATKAASDLGEAANITGVVFGEARGEIDEFVKTTAEGLGQSERAAREATAQFGGLLDNLGFASNETVQWSKDLTTLASDLGSAFNKDPSVAVQALGSALRGETEPIRQFNVMLDDATVRQRAVSMGLAASTAEVDKNAKAQASLAIIMEQTSKYQGDFANTSDGLANQSRILKARLEDTAASIGERLVPMALKGAETANTLLSAFTNLDPGLQTATLGALGFTAALGPAMSAAGNLSKAASALHSGVSSLGAARSGAFAVAAAGMIVFTKAMIDAEQHAHEMVSTLTEDVDTNNLTNLRGNLDEVNAALQANNREFEGFGSWAARFGRVTVETLTPMKNSFLENKAAYEDLGAAQEDLSRDLTHLNEVVTIVANTTGLSAHEAELLATKYGVDLTQGVGAASNALIAQHKAATEGSIASQELAGAQETLASNIATTEDKLKAFKDALDAALGVTLSERDAARELAERTDELGQAIEENGTKVGIGTEQQRNLGAALDGTVEAAIREVAAITESGQISAEAGAQKDALRERLENLKKKFPELAGPIQEYIDKLNSIPEKKSTDVILTWHDQIELAGRNIGGGFRARGGPVYPNQTYLVGEDGPELLTMNTPRPGRVIPADQTSQMLSSSSGTGTIELNQTNHWVIQGLPEDITRQVEESLARSYRELRQMLRAHVGAAA